MNNYNTFFLKNSGFLRAFKQIMDIYSPDEPVIDVVYPDLKKSTLECLSKITSQGAFDINELDKLYNPNFLGKLNAIAEDIIIGFMDGVVEGDEDPYAAFNDTPGIDQSYKKAEALSNELYGAFPCFSNLSEKIDGRSYLFYGTLLDSSEQLGLSINSFIHCFDGLYESEEEAQV